MKRRPWLRKMGSLAILAGLPVDFIQQIINIEKRTIPSSEERLPVVGLGTWQTFDVGSSPSQRDPLRDVLRALTDAGGSVVDSSPMYGRSEQVVGDLSSELGLTSSLFLATKVWTTGKEAGISQMTESSRKMGKTPLDLIQVHNLVDADVHLKTLQKWKAEGRVRYIGITHYHEGAYGAIERFMKAFPLDFIQINYSMSEKEAANRILPLASDLGMAVIINRPFGGGLLFSKVRNLSLPPWADNFDCRSWGQFFLKFILAHPAVTCVIPGTSKVHHMVDNLGAGTGRLPSEQDKSRMVSLLS